MASDTEIQIRKNEHDQTSMQHPTEQLDGHDYSSITLLMQFVWAPHYQEVTGARRHTEKMEMHTGEMAYPQCGQTGRAYRHLKGTTTHTEHAAIGHHN